MNYKHHRLIDKRGTLLDYLHNCKINRYAVSKALNNSWGVKLKKPTTSNGVI